MSNNPEHQLTSKTFADLGLTKKPVVSVSPQCTIQDALKTMADNNILTLPVSSRAFPDKFVYILSTLDILLYVVKGEKGHTLDLTSTVEAAMTMDAEMESYRVFERDFRDTIESTMVMFAKGLHRALITDALKVKPSIIITQSDFIQYIHKNVAFKQKDKFILSLPVFSKTMSELGLVSHKVVSMKTGETALDGFNRMAKNKMYALPVLDGAGLVVATLSASDLRGLSKETLEFVKLNVLEFLKKMHLQTTRQSTSSLVPSDTLLDAVNMLAEKDVHRLWILDSMLRPIGVVSQSDVLAAILGISAPRNH
ncbi:hypothetical protein HDU98_011171 [Podochytrium sp. JEL0797]|nr:hypothetical protein HDU98_011171 [Podochytrium sp. JEL0797]